MGDPDVAQVKDEAKVKQVPIREASLDSSHELGDSGEELPSEGARSSDSCQQAYPYICS